MNPRGRDLNPAKTLGLPTEITDLVSGPNEAQVLDVSSQKEFSERQSDRLEVNLFNRGSFHRVMSGKSIPIILGKGWEFPENGQPSSFLSLWLALKLQ